MLANTTSGNLFSGGIIMFRTRFFSAWTAALCLCGAVLPAAAAEVDCDSIYCFSAEDFSSENAITGICITGLPEPGMGTVMLGTRCSGPGIF